MKPSRRSIIAAGLGAVAGAAVGAFGRFHRPMRNIVWIVADAMRADAVGRVWPVRGTPASITPNIDRLTAEGLRFDRAIAPSSWTRISVGSFLWGTSPANVAYTASADDLELRVPAPSLPVRLAGAGYETAMVNANWVLNLPAVAAQFGTFRTVASGTEDAGSWARHGDSMKRRATPAVLRETERLAPVLAASDRFFLYVHLMDTHEPYFCPAHLLGQLGGRFDRQIFTTKLNRVAHGADGENLGGRSSAEALGQLRLEYDAATMAVDAFVGVILGQFRRSGLLDDTLFIVTADHGEEFADNVEGPPCVGHALNLSQPQIHVPLVAWSSRGRVPQGRVEQPYPMRRALEELTLHGAGMGEAPAFARVEPPATLSLLRIADRFDGWSYIRGDMKLVGAFGDHNGAGIRAFRLGADPRAVPLPAGTEAIVAHVARNSGDLFDPGGASIEQREGLKALGYLN